MGDETAGPHSSGDGRDEGVEGEKGTGRGGGGGKRRRVRWGDTPSRTGGDGAAEVIEKQRPSVQKKNVRR